MAHDPDLELDIPKLRDTEIQLSIFDYGAFKRHLAAADKVLMLADNAGETVFDRLLIEMLGKPVTYAVKSYPIINDTLATDAIAAGIDQVAEIMETGSGCAGDVLRTCTPQFNRVFQQADMVIAKGQGNLEALSEVSRPIFFILKVKCDLIARHLNAPIGSLILNGLKYLVFIFSVWEICLTDLPACDIVTQVCFESNQMTILSTSPRIRPPRQASPGGPA